MTNEELKSQTICALRMRTPEGTECVRIIRRGEHKDPDFLMADGTCWNVGDDMAGHCYALPPNREFLVIDGNDFTALGKFMAR